MSATVPARQAVTLRKTRTRTAAALTTVATLPDNPPANAQPMPGDAMVFWARAANDQTLDAEKLAILYRIQQEIEANDAKHAFYRAMSAAQAEMQPVLRDATNTQTNSKYARLETIDAAIRPIYTRHGFALTFDTEQTDGPRERVICEVTHAGRHTRKYQLEAGVDTTGPKGTSNKTPLHGLGSTVSYLRRYLTCMIFNVVLANDDNDGNRTTVPTDAQPMIAELYELLAACSANPKATAANEQNFLARMKLEQHRSIERVPASEHPRLRNALLTKLNVMAQRAQPNQQATAIQQARTGQTQTGASR